MSTMGTEKMRTFAIWDICRRYPNLSLFMGVGSAFITYYLMCVVKKPRVACSARLGAFLKKHCPILKQHYWPTWWCFESKTQTILRSFIKSNPKVPYQKEFLYLSDGGHVALDWLENDELSSVCRDVRPTVIILPGLTGSSQESYALHIAQQTLILGYRCVVFNYRGFGGAELKTPRTYSATSTEDLTAVIQSVKSRYPHAPLLAVGISLGGLILTNYLAEERESEPLVAAMTVSAAWNVFESAKTLEEKINRLIFNRHLTESLKENIRRYEHIFTDDGTFDLEKVYSSKTIREFDDHFTSRQFGYSGYKDYYDDACIHNKIEHIQVPLLCLNASDDPFSPEHAIPMEEAKLSKFVAIVQTAYGGHIGFLEGIFPRHTSYMDRVFSQYIKAIFEDLDGVRKLGGV